MGSFFPSFALKKKEKMSLMNGNFVQKKTQESVDWMLKCGYDKAEAESCLNTEWTYVIEDLGDLKFICTMKCPQLGLLEVMHFTSDGVEREVNMPIYGGKAKVTSWKLGENKFKGKSVTEKYGETEWIEEYTEDGFHVEMTSKGNTLKEMACRHIEVTGGYEFAQDEGLAEFLAAEGHPSEYYTMTKNSMMWFDAKADGKTTNWGESFRSEDGGTTYSGQYVAKLDEECLWDMPEFPTFKSTYVLSKTGNGKFSSAFKELKSGKITTCTYKFCDKGLEVGLKGSSGKSCTYWMKRMPMCFGKWEMVTESGGSELTKALGFPDGMFEKLVAEGAITEMVPLGGDKFKFNNSSKIMPMAMNMRWGVEHTDEFGGKKFTLIYSLKGLDSAVGSYKMGDLTVAGEQKFGKHFMTIGEKLIGTDLCSKTIFRRVY